MTSVSLGGELSTTVHGASGSGDSTSVGLWAVNGLKARNNGALPDTHWDSSADSVSLYNPTTGAVVVRTNTGTVINDTTGVGAGGRDQVGAFGSSSWIHFYFIWNGTTLNTVSSTAAPPTGPTLPSGYTHWAYIGAVRYNVTPVLWPTRISGSWAFIDLAGGGENRMLNGGLATSMTAVDCSTAIPPNSRFANFMFFLGGNPAAPGFFSLALRPTGSGQTGQGIIAFNGPGGSVFAGAGAAAIYPVSALQSIDYKVDAGSGFGGIIDVIGYQMPNGGE